MGSKQQLQNILHGAPPAKGSHSGSQSGSQSGSSLEETEELEEEEDLDEEVEDSDEEVLALTPLCDKAHVEDACKLMGCKDGEVDPAKVRTGMAHIGAAAMKKFEEVIGGQWKADKL